MAKQSFTKDERFMIQAYETAMLANDPELIMDRYDIGNKIGLQSRGVNTICNLLCQKN